MRDVNKIGKKIKKIRNEHNMSQERFGKRVGISGKTISSYENGRSMPSLKMLEKISRAYSVDIIELRVNKKNKLLSLIEDIHLAIEKVQKSVEEGLSL